MIEGQGIEIRGLSLFLTGESGRPHSLVEIDELLLACNANLKDLIQNQLDVQQIIVRRPKLTATMLADGNWDVERLYPLPKFSDNQPTISIDGGSVEINDPSSAKSKPLVLREGQVRLHWEDAHKYQLHPADPLPQNFRPVTNSPKQILVCEATAASELLERVTLQAILDPETKRWRCSGQAKGIKVSPELFSALPASVISVPAELDALRATGKMQFELLGDPSQTPAMRVGVDCTFERGQLDDPRLPFPLVDLEGQLRLVDSVLTLDRMTARHGQTQVYITGERRGLSAGSPMDLVLKVRKLVLQRDTIRQLPTDMQEEWQKYLPSGEIDFDLWLTYNGTTWIPDLTVRLVNVAFSHHKFPYRVDQSTGSVTFSGGVLGLDITAQAGDAPVRILGRIENPGPDWTGEAEVAGTNITIDDRLIFALPEKGREIVRRLGPSGVFDVGWKMWRKDAREPEPHKQLNLALKQCGIRYEKFAYPLTNISGTVSMRDDYWSFRDLEGFNDTGFVTCKGELVPVEEGVEEKGTQLALHFAATNVPLDAELRDALKPETRKVWNDLKPQGNIDLTSELIYFSATKDLDVRVNIEPVKESVSIEPAAFPYRLEKIQGGISYHNGMIQWTDVKAEHGRTEIACGGTVQTAPNDAWQLQLTGLTVDRLQPDRDLLLALPSNLRRGVGKLNPSGQFNLTGNFGLQRDPGPEQNIKSSWDFMLTLGQASVDCGLKLQAINGDIRITGGSDGKSFRSIGEFFLDSLMYQNMQFTEIHGPWLVDETRFLMGAWVEHELNKNKPVVRPPRRITAKLFNGTIVGDGWVAFKERPSYALNASLTDGSLSLFAQETLPGVQNLKGFASAAIELHGTGPGTNLLGGQGSVTLRETDIGELPVMVQLLKVLRARSPNATAFTSSEMNFRIEGEHIYFDKLDLLGDAVSLYGKGELDFQRNVKLWFHTVLGRNDLPFASLRQLIGEASGQILQIRVNGSLDEPEITNEVLPAVNKALQQLQAELNATTGPLNNQGGRRPNTGFNPNLLPTQRK